MGHAWITEDDWSKQLKVSSAADFLRILDPDHFLV